MPGSHTVYINLDCGAGNNGFFPFSGREMVDRPWTDNDVCQLDGRTRMTL
jgi:hypothetical protein